MNEEAVKTLVKEVDNELFDVVNHLICSICHELFNKPVTTPCGHSFCNGCIKRVISTKNSIGCPLCKNSLTRYNLMTDKVKSTLSVISRELPTAFKIDVEKLNYGTKEVAEDLIKRSKLFQLHSNDFNIKPTIVKRKLSRNKTCASKVPGENYEDSFVPLIKHSKNVKVYSSSKKKEMDDLISVSQIEVDLSNSLCEISDVEKKLEKLKKIPAEEKVKQWFDNNADNSLINPPTSSEAIIKKESESKNLSCHRIRIDYAKPINSFSKENDCACDPYEFIPSQNNKPHRKKLLRSRKRGKKTPHFKALQMLSKENIKRSLINKEEVTENSDESQSFDSPARHEATTASQKFDKLLMETKEKEKKETLGGHTLYCFSQSSSVKFLDLDGSKIDCTENYKRSSPRSLKTKLGMSDEEGSINENICNRYLISNGTIRNCKRKRSRENIFKEDKKPQLPENCDIKTTKLMDLLNELVNDDIIYNNFKTTSVKFETNKLQGKSDSLNASKKILSDNSFEFTSQNTQLLGFVTPNKCKDVEKFKEMVATMEVELEYEQNQVVENTCVRAQKTLSKNKSRVLRTKSIHNKVLENMSKDQPCKVVPFNLMGRIKKIKTYFIEFIQLGRLTPTKRRSRSCVVKLVFPTGFSSFAKHQSIPGKFKKSISVASASTAVQASHLVFNPLGKVNSEKKTSVEIQTSQQFTSEVQIQTSQTLNEYRSTEIQTSQVPYDFVRVEGTQIHKKLCPSETSDFDISQSPQIREHEVKTIKNIQISLSSKKNLQNLVPSNINDTLTSNNNKNVETEEKFFNEKNDSTKNYFTREVLHSSKKPYIKDKKTYEGSSEDKSYTMKGRTPVYLCSQGFIDDTESIDESVDSLRNLVVEFNLDKALENPCSKNTQESYDSLEERRNKKNDKSDSKCANGNINDSYFQSTKGKSISRTSSTDSLNSHEVIKICQPSTVDRTVVNFETDTGLRILNENSEDQLLRVVRNVDIDLKGRKELDNSKSEKSEESDSDFFVEQTPPNPKLSNTGWNDRNRIAPTKTQIKSNKTGTVSVLMESIENYNPDNGDLIGDSLSKELLESESIFLLSGPEKVSIASKNTDSLKESSKTIRFLEGFSVPSSFPKPNEINQNNLTAEISKEKESKAQSKTFIGALKQTGSQEKKIRSPRKNMCIVASSVNNPELIKTFVNKFKLEYSNKLTKDMTHLIVGLHKNEESELLPLCTPKLLFAMANKKWIVSEFWAESCLKMNAVLSEEPFETLDPVGGRGCRNARLSTGNLLEKCDVCLMGKFQTISKEEFASLIIDCGGTLIASPKEFSFATSKIRMIVADRDCFSLNENEIRELYEKYSTAVLSRDVIIMSIQSYKLSNFTPYLLHVATEEELVRKGYPPALVKSEEDDYENVTKIL